MLSSWRRTVVVVGVVVAVWIASAGSALASSGWSATGSMSTVHRAHTAVRLQDGRVLVIGGFDNIGGEVAICELYDPATGTWSQTGSLGTGRYYATATPLQDGRVLIVGGFTAAGVTATSELYDPSSGAWAPTGSMSAPRNGHRAVPLRDGRVLVAGGSGGDRVALRSGELYDPATGTWTPTANGMTDGRDSGTLTLLADGRVLASGGYSSAPTLEFYDTADLYDPATNSWTSTGAMTDTRAQAAVATLADGRAFVAGGVNRRGFLTSFELYDPATGVWAPGGAISVEGSAAQAASLDDGRVLLMSDSTTTTDLFDPASGQMSSDHALSRTRAEPSMTSLEDGRILVAGGSGLSSAELFTPPASRSAAATDFGEREIGSGEERDVTVENSGGNRLWIDGAELAGTDPDDFAIVSDACSGEVLLPGETCTVRVRFTPSTVGRSVAQLIFDDNAESSPPAALTAAGSALPADPDPPAEPEDPADPPTPPSPPNDPGPPSMPAPAPGPPPATSPVPAPAPAKPVRAIERFRLASQCVRPSHAGLVRIPLRLRLADLGPVQVRIERAVGTGALRSCPKPSRTRHFGGRFQPIKSPSRMRPQAVAAVLSGQHTLSLRLTPGLYRITVRAYTASGRLSDPRRRFLRVLTPSA
jgi:hypothetical protein